MKVNLITHDGTNADATFMTDAAAVVRETFGKEINKKMTSVAQFRFGNTPTLVAILESIGRPRGPPALPRGAALFWKERRGICLRDERYLYRRYHDSEEWNKNIRCLPVPQHEADLWATVEEKFHGSQDVFEEFVTAHGYDVWYWFTEFDCCTADD